jgi:hypothetical protein
MSGAPRVILVALIVFSMGSLSFADERPLSTSGAAWSLILSPKPNTRFVSYFASSLNYGLTKAEFTHILARLFSNVDDLKYAASVLKNAPNEKLRLENLVWSEDSVSFTNGAGAKVSFDTSTVDKGYFSLNSRKIWLSEAKSLKALAYEIDRVLASRNEGRLRLIDLIVEKSMAVVAVPGWVLLASGALAWAMKSAHNENAAEADALGTMTKYAEHYLRICEEEKAGLGNKSKKVEDVPNRTSELISDLKKEYKNHPEIFGIGEKIADDFSQSKEKSDASYALICKKRVSEVFKQNAPALSASRESVSDAVDNFCKAGLNWNKCVSAVDQIRNDNEALKKVERARARATE